MQLQSPCGFFICLWHCLFLVFVMTNEGPFTFQMEEKEHMDREQQRAMFLRKLDKLKKYQGEYD